jgi:hypothetical protein
MVIAVLSPAAHGIPRFILENHSPVPLQIHVTRGNSLGTIPEFFFASSGAKKRGGWMGTAMNASFYFLDRATHIKIVLLAAVLAGVVVAVGKAAQGAHAAGPAAHTATNPVQPAQGLKAQSAPVARTGTGQV